MSMETGLKTTCREFRSGTTSANLHTTQRPPILVQRTRLFDAQRNERVDASGAARGKIASQQGHPHQQQRYAHVSERIGRADAVQQAGALVRNRQRTKNPTIAPTKPTTKTCLT